MVFQASGLGGTVQQSDAGEKIKNMATRKERLLTVRFNADKSATMQWAFKPQQSEVKVIYMYTLNMRTLRKALIMKPS